MLTHLFFKPNVNSLWNASQCFKCSPSETWIHASSHSVSDEDQCCCVAIHAARLCQFRSFRQMSPASLPEALFKPSSPLSLCHDTFVTVVASDPLLLQVVD